MDEEYSIITCQNCGESLEAGWKKCPACLTPTSSVGLTCPNCQRSIKENWKLCPYCKTTLQGWDTPVVGKTSPTKKKTDPGKARDFVSMPGTESATTVEFSLDLPIDKGDMLDERYRIIQSIGMGGFGSVYQVEDTVLNKQMALKVVTVGKDKCRTKRAAEQIHHEFMLRDKITDTSYIIKAQDPRPCEYKGLSLVLLPMELADGGNLRQWLLHNQDVDKRMKTGLEFFKQACMGIKAIHDAGLVHLDIKPENILLVDGKAKIVDFGIGRYGASQFTNNPEQLLRQGIGTPQYMSPEQFYVARQKDVGPTSDVYSLGILLFELLDGNLPFDGSPVELREKHSNMIPPVLTTKLVRWQQVVGRCMAKKPEDRYSSIEQLLKDMERIIKGLATSLDVLCPVCGHINIDPDNKICDECQTRLDSLFRTCPVCTRAVRRDVKICKGCGKAVAAYYLLLDRKEQIEKLKDEDPAEAIEVLETVLQEGVEDFRAEAKRLIKELREKQSQISPLITRAGKAESSHLPEQAIEVWQEVLNIVPRHQGAVGQIQKLEALISNYKKQWDEAIVLMDEAEFVNAETLLQDCLKLIPGHKEVEEMIETCQRRAKEYIDAINQASLYMKQELFQDADKQIKKAFLQAPKGKQTESLSNQIDEAWAGNMVRQAKTEIKSANFKEAVILLNQAEELCPTAKGLEDGKSAIEKSQSNYKEKIEHSKQAKESADLGEALKAAIEAQEICPDSQEATDLVYFIEEQQYLVKNHRKEAENFLERADFKKAREEISKARDLWQTNEELKTTKSKVIETEKKYKAEMRSAESALSRKDFEKAVAACTRASRLCPESEAPNALEGKTNHARVKEEEKQRKVTHHVVVTVKWAVILLPGLIGIRLLVYPHIITGCITIILGIIAAIVNQKYKTEFYQAIFGWKFIDNTIKATCTTISLLAIISGILSATVGYLAALIIPLFAVIYPFVGNVEGPVRTVVRWIIVTIPCSIGISMLWYAHFIIGSIAITIAVIATILNRRNGTKLYNAISSWKFATTGSQAAFVFAGLLLVISGVFGVTTTVFAALVFPAIAIICSFGGKFSDIAISLTKWVVISMAGLAGVKLLLYPYSTAGCIAIGACFLVAIICCREKARIYKSISTWNIVEGRLRGLWILLSLLLLIAGMARFTFSPFFGSRVQNTEYRSVASVCGHFYREVFEHESLKKALLADARQLKSKDELEKSLGCITKVLALDPDNIEAGQLHVELTSLIEKQKVEAEKQERIKNLLAKAKIAEDKGNLDEALTLYQNARSLATASAIIAVIDSRIEDISNEKEKITRITLLLAEAQTFKSKDEFKKSLGCITEILNLAPHNTEAKQLHAELIPFIEKQEEFRGLIAKAADCETQKNWGKAIEIYNQAITIKPNDGNVQKKLDGCNYNLYLSQAELAEQEGNFSSAIQYYQKLQEFTDKPLHVKIDSLKRQITEQQKQGNFNKLLEQTKLHFDNSAFEEALLAIQMALDIYPNHVEAVVIKRKIREKIADECEKMAAHAETKGKLSEAIQLYQKAQRYSDKSFLDRIKKIELQIEEQNKRRKFLELITYAESMDSKRTGKKALEALEQALKLYPNDKQAVRLREKIKTYYIFPWAKAPFNTTRAKQLQQQTAVYFETPVEKTIDLGDGVKMEFVLIPAGEYDIGPTPFVAYPEKHVKIDEAFYIGKFEVTQSQFKSVMGITIKQARDKCKSLFKAPIKGEGPNYPMYYVTWTDADQFCKRVSRKKNVKLRLPTEAEWEYVCRAGTQTRFYWGKDTHYSQIGNYAWCKSNSGQTTHPVGQRQPNPFGLCDISGNISEWCQDYHYHYSTNRILRGGSVISDPYNCRSNDRQFMWDDCRSYNVGFRVVMELANQ